MSARPTLTCITYTRLWTFSRHTYTLFGHRLWLPISHRAVGYLVAVAVPIWLLAWLFGIPFVTLGWTIRFTLPYFAAKWALKAAGVGSSPIELVLSGARLWWHRAKHRNARPVRIASAVTTPLSATPVRIKER